MSCGGQVPGTVLYCIIIRDPFSTVGLLGNPATILSVAGAGLTTVIIAEISMGRGYLLCINDMRIEGASEGDLSCYRRRE